MQIGMMALAAAGAAAEETVLHRCESIADIRLTWGEKAPDARLELNTDRPFVSEGSGSVHAQATAPADAAGTSYIGFRIPVVPLRLADQAIAFDAGSSRPATTLAFYARGLNAQGKIVLGWTSWSNPLTTKGKTFILVPGRHSHGMAWEKDRIEAPGEAVTALEFIAGCTAPGRAFDLYVDHVRVVPAPPLPPRNWVDHGVVAPVGMPTWGPSTIATVDAAGRRLVFVKLWTGNNASYLFIDAETGQTEQVDPGAPGWGAYEVLMPPGQTIYDTMGQHLVAIDVPTRTVRRLGEIGSGMALSYVCAGDGTVYAGIYPSATLVSYHPGSGTFTNHGALNHESWPQYPQPLAIDAAGWVYCGISIQAMQIVGLNPKTGEKQAFIPADKRQRGHPKVYRGDDGKVYAWAEGWAWHELSGGEARPVGKPAPPAAPKDLRTFPDGSRCTEARVPDRILRILDAGAAEPREVHFDYRSSGVNIYTIVAGPDGNLHGATGIPLRIWRFEPGTGALLNRGLGGYGGHINQFVRQGDKLYGAVYSSGALLEYDPQLPYDDAPMDVSTNPRQAHAAPAARDLYGRPHAVLAHPDGRHILVGGNAARVVLGSGLLIYDRETGEGTILDRSQLIPDQGINALAALADGDVLVGTSVYAPTGGAPALATAAMVYRLSLQTRAIAARWPLQPETPAIRDLVVAGDGMVYGLAEPDRLFVLDPARGAILRDEPLRDYGGVSGFQAPRCMTIGPDGAIYALFRSAVVRIEPGTCAHRGIAYPDATITAGIAILGNRLYFGCGPRLLSCAIAAAE